MNIFEKNKNVNHVDTWSYCSFKVLQMFPGTSKKSGMENLINRRIYEMRFTPMSYFSSKEMLSNWQASVR